MLPTKQTARNAFYGTVRGSSPNAANRMGSKRSGITAAARSWTGSVIVELHWDDATRQPWVHIGTAEGSCAAIQHQLLVMPLYRLMETSQLFTSSELLDHTTATAWAASAWYASNSRPPRSAEQ